MWKPAPYANNTKNPNRNKKIGKQKRLYQHKWFVLMLMIICSKSFFCFIFNVYFLAVILFDFVGEIFVNDISAEGPNVKNLNLIGCTFFCAYFFLFLQNLLSWIASCEFNFKDLNLSPLRDPITCVRLNSTSHISFSMF